MDIRSKRHHLGTSQGGESFLLEVELPDGIIEEVEVWQHIFDRHEVGDSIGISFFQGPAWWGTTVNYGQGWASSPRHLVAPLFLVLGIGMLMWGLTKLA